MEQHRQRHERAAELLVSDRIPRLTEEQLRAAQRDPDRYRYLMVRVFGLSAQFVNLSPELQETVIERVAAASRRPA